MENKPKSIVLSANFQQHVNDKTTAITNQVVINNVLHYYQLLIQLDPIARVECAHDLVDQVIKSAIDNGEISTYACSSGCFTCCNAKVFVSFDEFNLLSKKYKIPTINRKICPYLSDGRCSVYKNRPIACRNVYKTKICKDGIVNQVQLITEAEYIGSALASINGGKQLVDHIKYHGK